MKKYLIYGGTFDPPHLAHTQLAKKAMGYLGCDKVIFMLAASSPFKESCSHSSEVHRLAMLKATIANSPWAEISTVELERGGTSYTFDTLVTLQQLYGKDVRLTLLIGEDQAELFHKWHRADEIESMVEIAVLAREGSFAGRFRVCTMKKMPLSSTHIRSQVTQGNDISTSVCPEVLEYITKHSLYK